MFNPVFIDADSIVYITAFNKKDAEQDKTLDECKAQVDNIIENIIKSTGATHYVLALTIGKCFRYKIYPEYKANRKYGEKPEHFNAIKQYLIDQYQAISHQDLESDDIIRILKTEYKGGVIASTDKDMLMLEGEGFNYKTGKVTNTNSEEAQINFWTSMIVGDPADNIKGIPGKGPKFASSYLIGAQDLMLEWVLSAYIDHFGEYKGILEFTKNYQLLYILEDYEDFIIPKLIEINNNAEEAI